MMVILHFFIVTVFLHPLFVTFGGFILFIIVINRLNPKLTRHLDADDLFWYKSIQSLDTFRLVWCDPSSICEEETVQSLHRIDPQLIVIRDLSKCREIIEDIHRHQCKSILLIMPGSIAKELVPRVLSDVHTIFIYCFNHTDHLDLLNQPKIDSISDSPSSLIQRIESCLSTIRYRYRLDQEQQSIRNLDKDTAAFIWFHSFRNVVRHFQKNSQAERDMMRCFRKYFQSNIPLLQKLDDFGSKYEADDAVWWYTHPNFISDPLNKALRSLDVDALFDLRYFIADLCEILEFLPRPIDKQPFYRAILMDKMKFDKLRATIKPGDLLSTRGFFSTSSTFEAAEVFGLNSADDPDKVEVIYKITVPTGLKNIIYADIAYCSYLPSEEEILFDLDSVFELIEIAPDPEKLKRWMIHMKATDHGRELAEKYAADTERQLKDSSPNIIFGKLLIDKGDHDKAAEYFQKILTESDDTGQENEHLKISRSVRSIIMNNMGHVWYKKGDYKRALQYFDGALALQQEEPPLNNLIPYTMNNRGVIFMMGEDREPALEAFEKGRSLALQLQYYDDLANCLKNIGTIKSQLGAYDEALKLFHEASQAMKQAGIHDDHWEVADNLMRIAFIYKDQALWPQALETLEEVKRIQEKVLPATHVDMGRTWFTIGVVLRAQQHYEEAFYYLNRALITYQQCLPDGHPYIADTYNSLAALQSVQEKFEEALPLYEQAKKQFRQWYGKDEHSDVARVLNNIGQVNRHLGHVDEAITCLKQALNLRQVTLGLDHPDTATTWVNLALAYRAQKDLPTALQHALRGLEIRREKLRPEHEDLLETEDFVRELQEEIDNTTGL